MLGKLSQDKPRGLGRICFFPLVPSLLYTVKEGGKKEKEKKRKRSSSPQFFNLWVLDLMIICTHKLPVQSEYQQLPYDNVDFSC